ncbi:MAG: alpha/beta hydrolase [Planctomycetes bacterium]|nr:alpha/beta hydrolase [Planctomycetota bacterium]
MPRLLPLRTRPRRRRLAIGALAALVLLALGALWTAMLVRDAERRFPARGRFVELDGARLHVLDRGAGPPIVLVHGAFGGAEDWEPTLLDALATQHRVLAFDRPGHGHSDAFPRCDGDPREQARVILRACRALGVVRPTVAGFSFGAAVALAIALEARGEIGALVTINGAMHSWGGTFEPAYDLAAVPGIGAIFTHTWATPLASLFAPGSVRRAFAPLDVPSTFDRSPLALAILPRNFAANAADIHGADAFLREQERRYAELALPLVVVVAEDDQVTTPSIHSHALAREIPGAELVSVSGAGHQLLYTHTALVIDAIERAAARAAATAGR